LHYLKKLFSPFGGLAPKPSPGLCPFNPMEDFRPSDPSLLTLKKSCGSPCFLEFSEPNYIAEFICASHAVPQFVLISDVLVCFEPERFKATGIENQTL